MVHDTQPYLIVLVIDGGEWALVALWPSLNGEVGLSQSHSCHTLCCPLLQELEHHRHEVAGGERGGEGEGE